jgi:hypothetical protein
LTYIFGRWSIHRNAFQQRDQIDCARVRTRAGGFTVDPCPKHLECFNGCRHLARSDVEEERSHLERLRDRMAAVIKNLEALPEDQRSIGWHNQIAHARARFENILATLACRPGEKPFPDGPDLYRSAESLRDTTILDTVTSLQDDP